MKRSAAVVALVLGGLGVRSARAAGPDELQLSLREGAAMVNVDGRDPWGIAAAVDAEYKLTDAWALRLSLEGSLHSVSAQPAAGLRGGAVRTDAALVGVAYALDILRLVPYAEAQLGLAQIAGAVSNPLTMLATEVGVGGDYYLTRRLVAGLSLQYLFRPEDLFTNILNLGNTPFEFSVTARLSWIF